MKYKAYPKYSDTPSRKTRKGARFGVFTANKKMRKAEKKAARIARSVIE